MPQAAVNSGFVMDINLYGINFKNAPVQIREQIALHPGFITDLLRFVRNEDIAQEALILSTCNRTEFYLAGADEKDFAHLLKHVGSVTGCGPLFTDTSSFYRFTGHDAVRHLFRTAASLESQAVGETEILGQIKNAYRLALDAGTARFLFNKMLHRAFRTAKRVHTETTLCKHPASIPTAAVEALRHSIKSLSESCIMVIGAGKTAETLLKVLVDAGLQKGFCVSRTHSSAAEMIARIKRSQATGPESCSEKDRQHKKHRSHTCRSNCAGIPASPPQLKPDTIENIPRLIGSIDAVISATSAGNFVLKRSDISGNLAGRTRALNMIDIAVPRDIDPALAELPCVSLTTIDELGFVIEESICRRRSQVPKAEIIVSEELEAFIRWLSTLQVAPTIKKLKAFAERQGKKELERRINSDADTDFKKMLPRFSDSLLAKLLHRPFDYLNRISAERSESDVMAVLDIIHEMFGLDEEFEKMQ